MSAIDQIKEMIELVGIKAIAESIAKPMTDAIFSKLAEVGIEAEVKLDIEVKSVNLEKFNERRNAL